MPAIELSQDDAQKVASLSHALQDKLQGRQAELGLAGFEQVPPAVVNSQEAALAKLNLGRVY